MKQVLIYGDSLTWGLIPGTRERLALTQRWPGVFETALLENGHALRVFENAINGRRTVWSDPFKPGRNGAKGLSQVMEMHSPLSLVVMMLGVNDFQSSHANTPALSAFGSARLIEIMRKAPIELGMPVPEILLVSPPPMGEAKGEIRDKFIDAVERSAGLAEAQRTMAVEQGVHYFNAGSVAQCSTIDGVHMEADQHAALGRALARFVAESVW